MDKPMTPFDLAVAEAAEEMAAELAFAQKMENMRLRENARAATFGLGPDWRAAYLARRRKAEARSRKRLDRASSPRNYNLHGSISLLTLAAPTCLFGFWVAGLFGLGATAEAIVANLIWALTLLGVHCLYLDFLWRKDHGHSILKDFK